MGFFNISKEVLAEKFLNPDNQNNQNIKKGNIFTGVRSSNNYIKNYNNKLADYSLDKKTKTSYFNETSFRMIEELGSMVYKRNVVNLNGAKSSAVPHGVINKTINSSILKPFKPRNGRVYIPQLDPKNVAKEYRNIARTFKNLNQ